MGGTVATASRKPHCVLEAANKEGMSRKSRIFKTTITDDYIFSSKIVGTGFSGPVRLATHKQTGKEFAVKRYDKNSADMERIEYLKSEAEVYLRLDHPNVCKLFAIYEDDRNVWIVMEYCAGEELYKRLHEKKVYSENDAADVTRQMVEAVHYLHTHHIVHRDLKLENWLYEKSDTEGNGRLKLIDFGFSKLWHPTRSKKMDASCGSLTYVSPDTLSGSYTNACDMWSLGVTVYFLLVGVPPFFGTERVIIDRILRGSYSMNGRRWDVISAEGKQFVQKLLVVDPAERFTSKEALNHPWIATSRCSSSSPLDSSVLHSLRQFALSSQMKRAALTMMAYSLTSKEIEELTSLFKQFDRNQDGCLSLSDFMEVMRENFNISHCEIEDLFRAMTKAEDVPDSEVCYSDFVAALLQTRLRFHEDAIREAFLKFDADRSGFITAGDLSRVIGDSFDGVDVDEIIRTADINGDGQIDYEEFLTAVLAEVEDNSPEDLHLDSIKSDVDPNERKWKVLKHLLGVVDLSIAGKEAVVGPGLRMMTSSRSSPHILRDIFGDFSADPRTPHARPWDARLTHFEEFALPAPSTPDHPDTPPVATYSYDWNNEYQIEERWANGTTTKNAARAAATPALRSILEELPTAESTPAACATPPRILYRRSPKSRRSIDRSFTAPASDISKRRLRRFELLGLSDDSTPDPQTGFQTVKHALIPRNRNSVDVSDLCPSFGSVPNLPALGHDIQTGHAGSAIQSLLMNDESNSLRFNFDLIV